MFDLFLITRVGNRAMCSYVVQWFEISINLICFVVIYFQFYKDTITFWIDLVMFSRPFFYPCILMIKVQVDNIKVFQWNLVRRLIWSQIRTALKMRKISPHFYIVSYKWPTNLDIIGSTDYKYLTNSTKLSRRFL